MAQASKVPRSSQQLPGQGPAVKQREALALISGPLSLVL